MKDAGPAGPRQQPPADELQSGRRPVRARGRPSRSAWSAIAADGCVRCPAPRRDAGLPPRKAGALRSRPRSDFGKPRAPAAAPRASQPTPPPTMNAASVAAIAPYTHLRGCRTSRSISSRFGTASSTTESYSGMQRFRHRAPRLHPRGIVGMRGEPRLDVAAAFRRQLVVDVSMQLVFGDGNVAIGHCRRLCPFLVCLCITPAIRIFISPAAAPCARPRAKL